MAWMSTTVLKNSEGNPIGIVGIARDITERQRAKLALATSEEKYRKLFEDSIEGIGIFGDIWINANKALLDIFGYESFEEFISVPLIYHVVLKYRKAFQERMREWNRGVFSKSHLEYKIMRKDGQIRHIELSATELSIGDSRYIQGTFRDITERKRAEKELAALNKKLIKSNKRLKQLSFRDFCTGLYNNRYLQEAIESEFSRALRYNTPFSVIMLDLDYFKSINDAYGHQMGDLILKQFARQLKIMVRRCDTVVRFGGEEFLIACPEIDRTTSLALARRILNVVNSLNFGNSQLSIKLKLSLAVVAYPENKVKKGTALIELADRILNKAKEDGGNRAYSYADIKESNRRVLDSKEEELDVCALKNKIDKLNKRASQSLIESVFAFARTIKLKDQYTGEHVENTVCFATEIAHKLGLTREEIENVRQASMLHDLGKIGVSEKILLKKDKLSLEEYESIKKHPQIGADILRPIHSLSGIIPLVLYHHERWDGTGYPRGLHKEEIPVEARIIAIADVYQALISDRPYRDAFSKEEAKKIIKNGSGTQFDPEIVDLFLRIID